jgi:hypothetical protein
MEGCMGLVDDLAFATMFENDNVLAQQPVKISIANELHLILTKLKLNDEFSAKQIEVNTLVEDNVPMVFLADKGLLRVIYNLCSNAIRFAPCNIGKVNICMAFESHPLSPSQKKHGTFHFKIVNSVEKKMNIVAVNRAFQYYYDDSMQNPIDEKDALINSLYSNEGVGLGLYVSFNIVQLLGGLLECTATDDESTFFFSVPVEIERSNLVKAHSYQFRKEETSESAYCSVEEEKWSSIFGCSAANKHFKSKDIFIESTTSVTKTVKSTTETIVTTSTTVKKFQDENRRRILVVDDSPLCQKVLKKALNSRNYDVDLAANGQVIFPSFYF